MTEKQHNEIKMCNHIQDEYGLLESCSDCTVEPIFRTHEAEIKSLCELMLNNGLQWLMWEFYKSPKYLQSFSPHGGDEDWLLLTRSPDDGRCPYVDILESGGISPSVTRLPNGYEIWIRAHA